jgi:hypothetical protein
MMPSHPLNEKAVFPVCALLSTSRNMKCHACESHFRRTELVDWHPGINIENSPKYNSAHKITPLSMLAVLE